jgi:hypothetical protein
VRAATAAKIIAALSRPSSSKPAAWSEPEKVEDDVAVVEEKKKKKKRSKDEEKVSIDHLCLKRMCVFIPTGS